jgi:hypothetical protein
MAAQWALTTEGDMLFPTNGEGASAITTDPATCAEIKISCVFGLVLGEWTLDTTQGFPWLPIWSQKNPNVYALAALFRATILGISVGMLPVASIEDLSLTYAAAVRNLAYAAWVKLSSGQLVRVPPVSS